MTSYIGVEADLTELADRLRAAAEALKRSYADHTLSSEERAALQGGERYCSRASKRLAHRSFLGLASGTRPYPPMLLISANTHTAIRVAFMAR